MTDVTRREAAASLMAAAALGMATPVRAAAEESRVIRKRRLIPMVALA